MGVRSFWMVQGWTATEATLSREAVFCKISRVLGSLCVRYQSIPHALHGPKGNDIAPKGQLWAVQSLKQPSEPQSNAASLQEETSTRVSGMYGGILEDTSYPVELEEVFRKV